MPIPYTSIDSQQFFHPGTMPMADDIAFVSNIAALYLKIFAFIAYAVGSFNSVAPR